MRQNKVTFKKVMSLLAFMKSVDILPAVVVQELTISFSLLNSIILNVNIPAIVDSQHRQNLEYLEMEAQH